MTFEEVRHHPGAETQRQWSERAIRRTTPALLGLFSLVTLLANRLLAAPTRSVCQAAWYAKQQPTFAAALAAVRRDLWQHHLVRPSAAEGDVVELPRLVIARLTETLCYAA